MFIAYNHDAITKYITAHKIYEINATAAVCMPHQKLPIRDFDQI